jgi:hypothetical protein
MPERRSPDATKPADLADRLAACLGPSMLAEDASNPDPLTVAAWHAMNALQRVVELLPDGRLAHEPDARFEGLTELAARGEGIVQATMDTLIAEGHTDPIVGKPDGHEHSGATTKPDTATLELSFPDEPRISLLLTRRRGSVQALQVSGPGESTLKNLEPAEREAVTAAVAEVAHALVSALSDA